MPDQPPTVDQSTDAKFATWVGDGSAPAGPPGYELLVEVGRGGMGVVYRARDVRMGREVAVKLLADRYPPDGTAARRFAAEARITGRLQHPGIPPVHEVGELADGRPFLAMKLIKGETLAEVLKGNPDRGTLVAVFEGLAQAVAYAHAHGVIHRDLKPANVMVGAFGEVQVMDWGLAKLLSAVSREAESAEPSADATTANTDIADPRAESDHTQDGQALGTPSYMAPEQALGAVAEMDRRTDVFGLGAVLCHLLTGAPPYPGGDAASTRLRAARGDLADALARLDGSDADPGLAALCRRCLSVGRDDRPADAGAVAAAVADLRRAADERARAAEVTAGEERVRAAEERKRKRLTLQLGGLAAAVLVGGLTAVGWQWQRAEQALVEKSAEQVKTADALTVADASLAERDVAQGNTADALRTLTDGFVIDQIGRKPFLADAERRFFQDVAQLWQTVADSRGDATSQRQLRAEGTSRVAFFRWKLGDEAAALAAYQDATDGYRRLRTECPSNPGVRVSLCDTLSNLATLLATAGRPAEAAAAGREALAECRALVAAYPGRADHLGAVADTQYRAAVLLAKVGLPVEAEEALRSARTAFQSSPPDHAPEGDRQGRVADISTRLGGLAAGRDRPDEAEGAYRDADAEYRRLAAKFPDRPEHRAGLAEVAHDRGLLNGTRRPAEAERQYRAAADGYRRLAAEFPSHPEYPEQLARVLNNLSVLLMSGDRPAESEAVAREAVGLRERVAADFPALLDARRQLALARVNHGQCLTLVGRPADARPVLQASVATLEQECVADPASAKCRHGLVRACLWLADGFRPDNAPAALRWYDKGLAAAGDDSALGGTIALGHASRGQVRVQLGRPAEAAEDFRRARPGLPAAYQAALTAELALALHLAGRSVEAVAEIGNLDKSKFSHVQLYNFACVYASARDSMGDKWGGRAVELLAAAVTAGYRDRKHMQTDPDLAPLRGRADFRALLASLPEQAPPPRPAK